MVKRKWSKLFSADQARSMKVDNRKEYFREMIIMPVVPLCVFNVNELSLWCDSLVAAGFTMADTRRCVVVNRANTSLVVLRTQSSSRRYQHSPKYNCFILHFHKITCQYMIIFNCIHTSGIGTIF